MTTPNRIALDPSQRRQDEAPANAALYPGHLVERISTGKVRKHATVGARARLLLALEDALQGRTTETAYAADEVVTLWDPLPGERFMGRVPAGAAALVVGDRVMSNGDGTFVKANFTNNPLFSSVAASAAVSDTVTETAFDKTYTFPANSLKAGDVIRIRAQVIATATNSTDTLTVKLKIGSTVVVTTGAVDVANNDIAEIDAQIEIRTVGASGTLVASGSVGLGASGTITKKAFNLASTTVDTTATQLISVTAQWSVASASNSCRLDVLTVASDRQEFGIAEVIEAKDNSAGVAEAFVKLRAV